MSRRYTYAIIAVAGVLTAALELLMHLIPENFTKFIRSWILPAAC